MKRNLIVQTLLLICLLITLPALLAAEENRRDGNWWREQDRLKRSYYVIGFLDGMDLGHKFSYWKFIDEEKMRDCRWQMADSYIDHTLKYFKNVTSEQLVDGLDSFYADFLNRSIWIDAAVWLVSNSIAGTPKKKLDSMIEGWRHDVSPKQKKRH